MKRYKIILLANNTLVRTSTTKTILDSGHQIKQVDHCVDLLRESRRIRPDLVLVPYKNHDAQLMKNLDIIESDRISSVCYLVDALTPTVVHALRRSNLGFFIPIGTAPAQLIDLLSIYCEKAVAFRDSFDQIDQLQEDLTNRKTIDMAKRHLMKKWNLPEDKAYQIMRKRSMDRSVKMVTIAEIILEENE